jgi:hypothetical protein
MFHQFKNRREAHNDCLDTLHAVEEGTNALLKAQRDT